MARTQVPRSVDCRRSVPRPKLWVRAIWYQTHEITFGGDFDGDFQRVLRVFVTGQVSLDEIKRLPFFHWGPTLLDIRPLLERWFLWQRVDAHRLRLEGGDDYLRHRLSTKIPAFFLADFKPNNPLYVFFLIFVFVISPPPLPEEK